MRKEKKLAVFFSLLVICFFVPFFSVKAANEVTITITPSIFDSDRWGLVNPGDVLTGEIKLTNGSEEEITFYPYLKDFNAAAEDESGKARLIVPGSETGNFISSWISISIDGIKLASEQEQVIPFTINVPENVGPGGYYGAIVFGTEAPKAKPGEGDKGASIGVAEQAASLVLLQIAGKADERADIREFKTDRNSYDTPFTVNFSTKIQNLGNVHVKPMGVIEITDMFGKNVTTLQVNDKGGNILPKSTRAFSSVWKDSFGFGRYRATLALSYGTPADKGGEGRKSLTMFWYFWVIPMKILVSLGASLLFLIALFIVFLRVYRRMAVKSAMKRMGVKGGQILDKKKTPQAKNEFFLTFMILAGIAVAAIIILYFILF